MELTITAGPPTLTDEEDPSYSFSAMEEEVTSGSSSVQLADPILPCVKPSIELTLLTDDDQPASYAKYTLVVPNGDTRSGSLDDKGFIHLDDLDVAADEVMLQVQIMENDEDPESVPEFTIQLIPKAAEAPEEGLTEQEPTEDDYFNPTFDHRIIEPADPEDFEDLDEL